MPIYRKPRPTFEAIQYTGDAKVVVDFVGEKNVFMRPLSKELYIKNFEEGYSNLFEGCYIAKDGDNFLIYSAENFEATFEIVE